MQIAPFTVTTNHLLAPFLLSISIALSSAGLEVRECFYQWTQLIVLLNKKLRFPSGHFVRQVRGLLYWMGKVMLIFKSQLVCYDMMGARRNTWDPGDSFGNLAVFSCSIVKVILLL